MKRSDVIKDLKTVIAMWSGGSLTSLELEEEASNLLKYLEKIGMSPPVTKVRTRGTGCDVYVIEKRVWEDEHEHNL